MHFRIAKFAILPLFLLIASVSLAHDSRINDIVGPERQLTPSEFHDILGKIKAYQLERSRVVQSIAAASGQSDFDPYSVDAQFYDVTIKVDIPTQIIYGNVEGVYRSEVDGLTNIEIDLDTTLTVDSVYNSSGNLSFVHSDMRLNVTMDRAYNSGEDASFNVVYHGHPTEGGFQAFSFDTRNDGTGIVPVVASLSEPYFARTWWPCKDRPDDKADSMDIHITNDIAYYWC